MIMSYISDSGLSLSPREPHRPSLSQMRRPHHMHFLPDLILRRLVGNREAVEGSSLSLVAACLLIVNGNETYLLPCGCKAKLKCFSTYHAYIMSQRPPMHLDLWVTAMNSAVYMSMGPAQQNIYSV